MGNISMKIDDFLILIVLVFVMLIAVVLAVVLAPFVGIFFGLFAIANKLYKILETTE